MLVSGFSGLVRSTLRRTLTSVAAPRRRQVRCSFSTASVVLETRLLPAATPVGDLITVATPTESSGVFTGSTQSVAVDDDGNFVIVWTRSTIDQVEGRDDTDIMAQRFNADGTPAGEAFQVNTTTADFQTQPTVAMNASGEFVVSWINERVWINQYGGHDSWENIYARRFDAHGAALGDDFLVNEAGDARRGALEVAIADDGLFMAAWNVHDSSTNSSEAVIRRFDGTGTAIGDETTIAYGLFMTWPEIEFTPDGGFVLAFTDDASLAVQRFDSNTNPIGYPTYVYGGAWINSPSIAVDETGDFVLAWDHHAQGYGNSWNHVYAMRFTADGVAAGEAFVVSSSELGHYDHSTSVAMSAEGHFIVTWITRDLSQPNTELDFVGRAFNADGVPIGGQFVVSPGVSTPGYYASGAVAMTPTGEAIINWSSHGDGVYAQRYQLNLVPTDITLSNSTVAENSAVGTLVGTLSGVDFDGDDSFTYELVSGDGDDDNAAFQIVGNELQTATFVDYELKSSYTIRVRATDLTGAWVEKTLTVQVTNVIEPQVVTLTNNSVDENLPKGTLVGSLGLTDAPDGSIRYRLIGGDGATGNGRFKISGNQLLTKSSFDAERQSQYSIRVQATDAEGIVTVQVFTIGITDVNEAPVDLKLSSSSVRVGQPAGTAVGQLTGFDVDAGETLTYTLVNGRGDRGNSRFTIVGDALVTAGEFAGRSNYSIRARVTDQDGASFERVFRIRVTGSSQTSFTGPLSDWLSHLWGRNSPWWKQRS